MEKFPAFEKSLHFSNLSIHKTISEIVATAYDFADGVRTNLTEYPPNIILVNNTFCGCISKAKGGGIIANVDNGDLILL